MPMPVGPPHILLVDDDPDICLALHDFLTHEGYDVQVARTGKEAVERAQSQQFDAVLLDLGLPDQDGLVVLVQYGTFAIVPFRCAMKPERSAKLRELQRT